MGQVMYSDGTPSREVQDDDDRPHGLDLLVAQKKRITELEATITAMRYELELAVVVALGCRVILERPVTEDDIQAAIAEARRLAPLIEAERAIRKALTEPTT